MTQHPPLSVGLVAPTGRMGRSLAAELSSGDWPGMSMVPSISRPDLKDLFYQSDVVLDFSHPDATRDTIWLASARRKPVVIGTTGLDALAEQSMQDAARISPIVYALNTSIAVTLLTDLVERTSSMLGPEWDIEILETHHHDKIDAPSGTAHLLGRAAARGRDVDLDEAVDWARHGQTGKRTQGNIGFAVRRGGDVVGEHTVSFYAAGERLELSHMATDRALFARGAIMAAKWVVKQPPGLYSMRDVLGL